MAASAAVAAASGVGSNRDVLNLESVDKVFSKTSGIRGFLGNLDIRCELLLCGGFTGEKLPHEMGSSPLHVFMRISSEKDDMPYRVVIRGDDQTREITCEDDSDKAWTNDHVYSVLDLGKINVHKSKGNEIKDLLQQTRFSEGETPSFQVSQAVAKILDLFQSPIGSLDSTFSLFEKLARNQSIAFQFPQLDVRDERPNENTLRSHRDFDAYVVKLLNGQTLESLQGHKPQLYATIRCIEQIYTLFVLAYSSTGMPMPQQFLHDPSACPSLTSPSIINIPEVRVNSTGELEALLFGRSQKQQLMVSAKKASDAANEACLAIDLLQADYGKYPEFEKIKQLLAHLSSVHPEVFQAGGLAEQWAAHNKWGLSKSIEWVERYATLCQLIASLAKKGKTVAERHDPDPKVLNKLGILAQMLILYMDQPTARTEHGIGYLGMYQFFSKISSADPGKKMPDCPVTPWIGTGETIKKRDAFIIVTANNCTAFNDIENMHQWRKSVLLDHILNPVQDSKNAWDLWR